MNKQTKAYTHTHKDHADDGILQHKFFSQKQWREIDGDDDLN